MKAKILLLFLMLNRLFVVAQTSIASGSWNSTSTWDCNCIPITGSSVTISSGHTVTASSIAANLSITVNAGGTLIFNNTISALISSFAIYGTLRVEASGEFLFPPVVASFNFYNNSTYIHARNGGTIPSATWQPNATCLVTGVTNTMPTGFAGQSFGNLTWDCSNQSTYLAFNADFNIQETFRVENSHDGSSPLGIAVSNSNTADYTVTTKDFIMDNPTPNRAAFYPYAGSNALRTGTLRVLGNVTIINNTITGVLSGVGKSRIELVGNNDAIFNQSSSFAFYGTPGAIWEVVVNKTPGSKVTFTSPMSIFWGQSSGTPTSILNVQSGIAEIDDNKTLAVSIIQGNATLNLKPNSTLQLINNNSSYNNTFSGTLNAAPSSTVLFDNNINQNIFSPTGSFGNITFTSTTFARTLTSNITLTGNFTDIAGNFVHDNHTVTFAGSAPQNISGNVEFYNLNINNDVALMSSANVRFKGQLSIANDKYLSLGDGNLIAVYGASSSPSFNAGTNKYVVTNGAGVVKIRNESGSAISPSLLVPMGYSTPMRYAGISFPLNNLPNNQEVSLQVKAPGTSPYPSITSTIRVDAVWQVTLPAGTTPNVPVDVYYVGSTVGGFTGGTAYYHNGTTWVSEATSTSNASTTSFTPASFTMGTRYYGVFLESADYYTLGDGAVWNVNSNLWSNDGTTPCNCSPNGVAGANVRIRHNTTILSGATVGTGTTIDIQNPVTLTSYIAFSANQLDGISGARLRMNINALPSININNFATTAGTIVEFAGGAGTIPNSFGAAAYRNLVISGTGTKNFSPSPLNANIQENLTIETGATFDIGVNNLHVVGSTTLRGTLTDTGISGTNRFSGQITINSGGALTAGNGLSNTSIFIFENNITKNGTLNLNCNCAIEFDVASNIEVANYSASAMRLGAMNSTGTINFKRNTRFLGTGDIILQTTGNINVHDNITVFNSVASAAKIEIYGHLNGFSSTSTWQQGDDTQLYYYHHLKPMNVGQLIANASGNVVLYENNTTNSLIKETTYYTLILRGTSIKFFSPNTIVEYLFDGSNNNNPINLDGNILQIRGNWLGRSATNLVVNNGRVLFNGTANQVISNRTNFDILEIANPAHVSLNGADNAANRIVLTQGRLQLGNSVFTLTASPATDQITQTFTNTSTSYIETNGTGNLTRNNLLAGTAYVFPVGDATAIRHFTITLPNSAPFVRGIFVPGVSPTPPPANTDIAAGRWLLQGANDATVSFHNSGATGFASKVYRFDGTNWTDAGITTNFNLGVYTASPLDFSAGETFTIFGQSTNHIILESSFTQNQQPDGSILLYAETNYGLPAKFISTNTNVAQIINDNILVITYNNADEFTDILAFNEGSNPIPPSDTLRVMRIYNFGYINSLQSDLEKKILLYPNPTADEIFVRSLDNSLQVEKISILNALGQSVAVKTIENKLSLAHLPAGVYVAEIQTSQGFIRRKVTKR